MFNNCMNFNNKFNYPYHNCCNKSNTNYLKKFNCSHCCSNNCIRKGSVINSLFCVENFLCNTQKACSIYKIFSFFR